MGVIDQFIKAAAQVPGNAVKDVGNIISGVGQIPGIVNNAIQNPSSIPGTLSNIGSGVANEFNQFAGNPIQNVPLVGMQTPQQSFNQQQATFQHAQQHPVNTALDVANLVGTVNALSPKTKLPPIETPSVRKMEPPPVSDVAANTYLKSYTVPKGLDVNSVDAAKWAINDNPNISNINDFLNNVEQMKRNVLGNAGDAGTQVNVDDALANGIDQIKKIPQLADNEKKVLGYQQELTAMLPKPQTASATYGIKDLSPTLPGETGSGFEGTYTTPKIGGAHPLDTYDAIKNIEQQGYAYRDAGTDVYGKITNPEYYKVGKAYIDTAKEMETALDSAVGKANVQSVTQDPNVLSQIQEFSPKVAGRLSTNVQNWSDLRALQKPYVDLNKIINYTKDSGHTAFANMSGGATRAITGGAGAALGEAVGGVPGAVIGGVAGSLLEPTLSAVGNKLLPPIARGVASTINAVPNISKASAALTPALQLASVLPKQPTNNNQQTQQPEPGSTPQSQNQTNNKQQDQHTGIISQPGRYSFQTPQQQGFLTTNDYTNQVNTIQSRLETEKLNNPQAAAQDQQVLDQLNTSYNNQKPLRDSGTQLNKFMGVANMAIPIIDKAPTSLLNLNGTYNNLLNSSDPNYRSLGILLQEVEKQTGIKISNATNKESLIQNLDNAMAIMQNNYNSQVQQFFGGNSLNAGAPSQTNLPPITNVQPQPQGLPSINGVVNVPFNFGGAGQNLPPIQ